VHDYGEENNHLRDAFRVMDGEHLGAFDYLRDGGFVGRQIDMFELYKFRLPVYWPSGVAMRVLGVSDVTLALWFVFCSLALVFLTYRLGATLYDQETGVMAALILAFFPFDVVWSSRINGDVSRDLDAIIQKCLEKQPAKRYSSAFELTQELERLAAGLPVVARPISQFERLRRFASRNVWLTSVSTLLVLALVVGLSLTTWLWLSSSENLRIAKEREQQLEIKSAELTRAIDRLFFNLATSKWPWRNLLSPRSQQWLA